MKIRDLRSPNVHVIDSRRALADAARLMCAENIGALVVVDAADPERHPIGILTDRDVVRGQLARSADLHCLTVADVMTRHPVSLRDDLEVSEALAVLSAYAVRRAPVVTASGQLTGFISIDDLLPPLADELGTLTQLMGAHAPR